MGLKFSGIYTVLILYKMFGYKESISLNSHLQAELFEHSENGLRVVLAENHSHPIVGYERVVLAGSANEQTTTQKGAAHFLEHMCFWMNRQENGESEVWGLEKHGAYVNAMTNTESTRFPFVGQPKQLHQMIETDAKRFACHHVDREKMKTEVQAVLNEYERGESAGDTMWRTSSEIAMLEQPQRFSTIGTKHDIKHTTGEELDAFLSKYYIPNNAYIVIVGDFNKEDTLNKLNQSFGVIPRGTPVDATETIEPAQLGKRYSEIHVSTPCEMETIVYHAPKGDSKESIALEVIKAHLNNQSTSLIKKNIINDLGITTSRQSNPSLMHICFSTNLPGKMDRAHEKVVKLLSSVKDMKESDMSVIRKGILEAWQSPFESVQDTLNELGRAISMRSWKDSSKRVETLKALTHEEVIKVAQDIFQDHQQTVVRVVPEALPQTTLQNATEMSKASKEPVSIFQPQSSSKTSSEKLQCLVVPHAQANRLIASFATTGSPDMTDLLVRSLSNGFDSFTSKDMDYFLQKHQSDRQYSFNHKLLNVVLHTAASKETFDKVSKVVLENELVRSSIPSSVVEAEKEHLIGVLNSKSGEAEYQMKEMFMRAIYSQSPYTKSLSERVQEVRSITAEQLNAYHSDLLSQAPRVTLTTPGNVKKVKALATFDAPLQEAHSQWAVRPVERREDFKCNKRTKTCTFLFGQHVKGLTKYDKELIALRCCCSVLGGGMTGDLMRVIRGQKGLGTYGIYSYITDASDNMVMVMNATFSPEEAQKGIEESMKVVQDFLNRPLTAEDVDIAKDKLLGKHTLNMDYLSRLTEHVHQHFLDGKDDKYAEMIQSLTVEDVEASKKYITPESWSYTGVGPLDHFEYPKTMQSTAIEYASDSMDEFESSDEETIQV